MVSGPTADGWEAAPDAADAGLRRPPRCGWRGRSQEWRVLAQVLRAAEGGRGGVLLIDGPSGMGKTRLLAEAAEAAASRGFTLARGSAEEPARLVPLAPLMTALGESTQTLLSSTGTVRADAADLRLWLVQELQALLEERAARGPHLITLDDLHWADPTTLLALRSLVPELASYPLVWILSRTTGRGDPGLDRLYEVFDRAGAARITLGALDDAAVAEVITDVLGAAADAELLSLAEGAGGNPFILGELLGGLRDEGAVKIVDGQASLVSRQLPHRLQEVARRRLSRLSSRSRHVLQVAAVLGPSFDLSDLAEMLGELPSQLLATVEDAEAAGAIVPAGNLLAFRHDLLWRAVTETIAPSLRQALHRQAAAMLFDRGGSAISAASHLLHSARPGDPVALAGLDRAVREVLPTSPQIAADLAVRTLELTVHSDAGRFDRTVTAIYALTIAGRLTEATELAGKALRRIATPREAAQLRYELANTLLIAGQAAEAVAEAEKALEQQALPAELRGVAEQVLFRGMFANHDRRGHGRAEAVVASAERHGPVALVGAYMLLTTDTWAEGRCAEAIGYIREATRIAAGGPLQAQHAHPRLHLISLLTDTRQLEEAENTLQAADEEIAALGHTAYTPCPAILRARLRLAQGRLDDAATEAQAGLNAADEVGMHAFDLLGLAVLAIVAVCHDDVEDAARYVERYECTHQRGKGATYGMKWGDWAATRVTEAQSGGREAVEAFHSRFDSVLEQRRLLVTEPNAAAWLTRVALAAGEHPTAEAIVEIAHDLVRANPAFTTYAASAAHARGVLRDDETALAQAVATYAEPWSRASAAEDIGVLRARSGGAGRETAVRQFDEALEGYTLVGATRDAARVRARLRGIGVRRRQWSSAERPASGWDGLTDTERNIAALVAQGLTNPQVATRMFISPHTVKFHLGQAFRKLSIGSRVELARIVAEHTSGTASGGPDGPPSRR